MTIHFNMLAEFAVASGWPAFADAAIKGLIVLFAAWIATLTMRHTSAAMRHLVWVLAVCGVLFLPMLSGLLPAWRILPARMFPTPAAISHLPAPSIASPPTVAVGDRQNTTIREPVTDGANTHGTTVARPAGAALPLNSSSAAILPAHGATRNSALESKPWWRIDWRGWAIAAWECGLAIMTLPVLISLLGLWRLGRNAKRIEVGSWERLLRECAGRLRLRHPVTLLRGRRQAMPMTWGILSPKLLLPPEADEWSRDRRRVVLMHELAHIKRGDFLTQLIVHLARAVYWFNPLIWIASKRIALESEGACDDLVLAQDTKASDYAEHLLTVAAGLREGILLPVAAVAMARSSRLEGRLLAILDARRNRATMNVAAIVVAISLMLGGLLPLAMVRAGDDAGSKNCEKHLVAGNGPAAIAGESGPAATGLLEFVRRFNTDARVGTIAVSAKGELVAIGNDSPTMILMGSGRSRVADNWKAVR